MSKRKRQLKDTDISDQGPPQKKPKKSKKKEIKTQQWKKLHLKVIKELMEQDGDSYKLIDDNIMNLRVTKDGKSFTMNFESKTVRPNMDSKDKRWLSNFTKQSLTSKAGICIREFTHGHNLILSITDKTALKYYYQNIMEHVLNIQLFRDKQKPAGIKKAKWNKPKK